MGAVVVGQPRDIRHTVGIPLAAHDQQRRPLGHIVIGDATEAFDDRPRFLAAERPQLAREDDYLTAQRHVTGLGHRVSEHDSFTRVPQPSFGRWNSSAAMSIYNRSDDPRGRRWRHEESHRIVPSSRPAAGARRHGDLSDHRVSQPARDHRGVLRHAERSRPRDDRRVRRGGSCDRPGRADDEHHMARGRAASCRRRSTAPRSRC